MNKSELFYSEITDQKHPLLDNKHVWNLYMSLSYVNFLITNVILWWLNIHVLLASKTKLSGCVICNFPINDLSKRYLIISALAFQLEIMFLPDL